MTIIDLDAPRQDLGPLSAALEDLPRRLALTLAELRYLSQAAGGAPLPFEEVAPPAGSALESRLGAAPVDPDEAAYQTAIAGLHDAEDSLTRRGLVRDGCPDAGVVGALGLLATPALAVDLEVAVGDLRARAWHRQSSDAVATLATADGIVFELAWFEPNRWAGELARVATVPEEIVTGPGEFPEVLELPFDLVDAAGEALRTGRVDLLPVLVSAHPLPASTELSPSDTVRLLGSLLSEARGRLRGLVADVGSEGAPVVGVVSWLLLPDGWRSLRTYESRGRRLVEIRRVEPEELAGLLAPVLAEVIR